MRFIQKSPIKQSPLNDYFIAQKKKTKNDERQTHDSSFF